MITLLQSLTNIKRLWRLWNKKEYLTFMHEMYGSQSVGGLCQGRPGEQTGAGAPPVAALGIIGQVASRD